MTEHASGVESLVTGIERSNNQVGTQLLRFLNCIAAMLANLDVLGLGPSLAISELRSERGEMGSMRPGGGRTWFARVLALMLALFLFFGWPAQTAAYAVLSHEAIIDSVWNTNIRPLLLRRFPDATGDEIKEAHGYAYGGAASRTEVDHKGPPAGSQPFARETTRSSLHAAVMLRFLWQVRRMKQGVAVP